MLFRSRERTIFGSTYNSFMGIHLGSDETAEDTDDYWVVMNSQSYGKMHFLKLRDLPEQKNESQVNVKTMGGKFIKAQEQALVKVMDTYDPEFWEDTTVIFSRDGKKAFIDTPDQLLTVNMDKQSPQYLEHSSVPHLQYDGVNMFARNDSQMFFCVRDEVKDKSTIKFLSEELGAPEDFGNTSLSCDGQVTILEAIEFERQYTDGNVEKVFRVTGIRESETLLSWEIIGSSKGDQFFKTANDNKLSTFRWPFYAYATDETSFAICPLAKPEYMVHHTLQLQEGK